MTNMDRRRVLVSLGLGICGFAGCLGGNNSGDSTQPEESGGRPDDIRCTNEVPEFEEYCGDSPDSADILVEYELSEIDASDVQDDVFEHVEKSWSTWMSTNIKLRKGSIGARELLDRTSLIMGREDNQKSFSAFGVQVLGPKGKYQGLTRGSSFLENATVDEGERSNIYYPLDAPLNNPQWDVRQLLREYGSLAIVPM